MDPKEALLAGEPILSRVLVPHGFQFRFIGSGKGSGGPFAQAEFACDNRRLELHYRWELGLVHYHIDSLSASHACYMVELGVQDRCQYPGFPKGPLDSFTHLAHDLQFAADFLTGSGEHLVRAGQKEAAETADRRADLMASYVGDTRKLDQLRSNFKQGHYPEVLKLADSLKFPERMEDSERKMVEIVRTRTTRDQ